ncbi:AraC family transcriptional regulator [Paenibacillus sp. LHD-117]|uniref:AraC family transcriptional regulator n=1 Tax=Paenibacillus sp. LHD-117 TaxID=3071412 RepID=UPI0027DF83B0|nr:AraC family transcriptional regulator [Paenibacillus sp. LHD-117]MDQ6419686.1 AraC family transcriptional regulator [Paenibacillus sp. LHD-117]
MKFSSMYRVPDEDDNGCVDLSSYLLVNSVGFYAFEAFYKMSHRKGGRKDFYLVYNSSGPMTVRSKGQDYILQPGSVFLYHPHEEQYFGHYEEQKFHCYWVHFTGRGVAELLQNANLFEERIFYIGIHLEVANLFENMMNEVRDKKAGFELASASLLSYLCSMISRLIHQRTDMYSDKNRKEIYESIKYIHEHYAKDIYVKNLADIAHLSTDRYTTLFKRITDTTPLQYLNRFRLQKACDLMKHTRLNIQQISSLVGFEDQLYFSRMFKKTYNMSPSEYLASFN